jgi:protein-disulfide isomerase
MQSLHRRLVLLAVLSASCTGTPAQPDAGTADSSAPFNVLGREDAPVTIIEFTDLQCPYCAQFAVDTFPLIRRNYIDTGVRLTRVTTPFPRLRFRQPWRPWRQGEIHEFARRSSRPSLARHRPYDELTPVQTDLATFDGCRRDGRQEANVRADLDLARSYGIGSTPTFVIGRIVNGIFEGETMSGAKPYEEFAAKIEALLAAES